MRKKAFNFAWRLSGAFSVPAPSTEKPNDEFRKLCNQTSEQKRLHRDLFAEGVERIDASPYLIELGPAGH